MFRRLRSIFKTGLLWAVIWVPLSFVIFTGRWVLAGLTFSLVDIAGMALAYGVTGFLTGSAFGALMSFTEAGNSVPRLRSWRVGLWGALGTMVIASAALVVQVAVHGSLAVHAAILLLNLGTMAAAGAASAIGMVSMARRGGELPPAKQPPLLP